MNDSLCQVGLWPYFFYLRGFWGFLFGWSLGLVFRFGLVWCSCFFCQAIGNKGIEGEVSCFLQVSKCSVDLGPVFAEYSGEE